MAKRFVYVLKTNDVTPRYYVGITSDVAHRLVWHNKVTACTQRSTVHGPFTSSSNSRTSRTRSFSNRI